MRPLGMPATGRVLVLVLAAMAAGSGCGPFDPLGVAQAQAAEREAGPAPAATVAAPVRTEPKPRLEPKNLPCFECHDYEWWAKGPAFPHRSRAHREEGHCNVCHGALGHEGAELARDGCPECHEPEELAGFPRGGEQP